MENRLYFEPMSFIFKEPEQEERKTMVVAVDFDGTIAITDYPKIIKPLPHAMDVLKVLMNDPYTILTLWTCREGEYLQQALDFCELYGVKFDCVNENPKERIELYGTDPRKIGADLYIDDKSPQINIEKLWTDWWDWLCENYKRP